MMAAKRTSRLLLPTVLSVCAMTTNAFHGPIALNVKVAVKPDRRQEFLEVIQKDAKMTVEMEPGALQFTLGEDTEIENTFYFHEQYKAKEDFEYHQTTPHFLEWKDFCATDPFSSETEVKIYQCNHEAQRVPMRPAFCLNVELCIKEEVRDEFLKVILNNQNGSREEKLCLQYDFGESIDTPNSFYFHEQYKGADAGKEGFDAHAAAPHFAVWEKFAATDPFTKPPLVSFFRTL